MLAAELSKLSPADRVLLVKLLLGQSDRSMACDVGLRGCGLRGGNVLAEGRQHLEDAHGVRPQPTRASWRTGCRRLIAAAGNVLGNYPV